MRPKALITALTLAALTAAPSVANDEQHHRGRGQSGNRSSDARQAPASEQRQNGRAAVRPNDAARQSEAPRQDQAPRYQAQRQDQARPQYQAPRQYQPPRGYAVPRQYDARGGYDVRRFDDRGYGWRRFGSAVIIRPSIVAIVPYRPYSYRPSWSIGIYYGAGGFYPYGYTPRGYYDPIPGRYYGGVRIIGGPRDAQVFADGYFVGIVDDFDGVFQHMNLEAGPHHIEIVENGLEPIAFDVNVRPGETITFRADPYRPY